MTGKSGTDFSRLTCWSKKTKESVRLLVKWTATVWFLKAIQVNASTMSWYFTEHTYIQMTQHTYSGVYRWVHKHGIHKLASPECWSLHAINHHYYIW